MLFLEETHEEQTSDDPVTKTFHLCCFDVDDCDFWQLHFGSPTVWEYSEWDRLAEGALGSDVQIDGGETEVVPGVIGLGFGHVQVPRDLRHKPASVVLFDEVGEVVDQPTVGQSWTTERWILTHTANWKWKCRIFFSAHITHKPRGWINLEYLILRFVNKQWWWCVTTKNDTWTTK